MMNRLYNPEFLLIAVFCLLLMYMYGRKHRASSIRYSDVSLARKSRRTIRLRLLKLPLLIRALAIVLIGIAIARPQSGTASEEVLSKGIDIMIVMDVSGSMRAIDPTPQQTRFGPKDSRMEVAKETVDEFITSRENDRIGIVVFSGHAHLVCPPTLDYGVLKTFLKHVEINLKDPATAIGSAIGIAVNHLKDSESRSKVIVLVTDGENNAGKIHPLTAASVAEEFGVKVYTIGIGRKQGALWPVNTIFGASFQPAPFGLDEETLVRIADRTGGRYFASEDPGGLENAFRTINALEKTEFKSNIYYEYSENFSIYLAAALGLLFFEAFLRNFYLRSLP